MNRNIIFGLGTGRCGTVSLSRILNWQEESNFTHEMPSNKIPWKKDEEKFGHYLSIIKSRRHRFVGDVASYYLPYCESIFENKGKVIILKRERQEVIESFQRKAPSLNHWVEQRFYLC